MPESAPRASADTDCKVTTTCRTSAILSSGSRMVEGERASYGIRMCIIYIATRQATQFQRINPANICDESTLKFCSTLDFSYPKWESCFRVEQRCDFHG